MDIRVDRALRARCQSRRGFAALINIEQGTARSTFAPLQLDAQSLAECIFVRAEGSQINLVTARNILRQVFDLHLQLRLANLLMTALLLRLAQ